jgi:poly(3-hydroxybutyrate) depolymerase/protocatechuate 3,4-dioxygenase beta subunit
MDRTRPYGRTTLIAVIATCLVASVALTGATSAGAAPTATAATAAVAGAPMPTPPAPSAGCGTSVVGAGDVTVTTSSGGVDRTYIRHTPPAHDGTTPVPLVIALHGLAEGSVIHQSMTEYAPRADANGFAVVYPQALGSPAAWNLSATSPDITFVTQVLDEIEASMCVDTNRVFVSGFSLGGFLTSLLMCGPLSERVAAAAPIAGMRNPAGCAPERPVPAITFHGTLDNWVPFSSAPPAVEAWAGRNGCDATPTETAVPGDDVVTIDHIVYSCPDGADVEWYEITGGGHAWPGSAFSRAIASAVGYTTFAISATDLVWDFFAAHPLPPPPSTEGTFDALTYNVAGLPALLSGSEPDINMPYISPLLNDYDLVLVQEDWDNPDPPLGIVVYHDILVADATHPYQSVPKPVPLGSNPLRPTALLSDGINHLSRFPFGEVTRVMWPNCFGGANTTDGGAADCLAEKGFSMTRAELAPGVEVDIYNLHAEAGNTPADMTYIAEDFEVLADFMAANSAGRAVLVGGDFNLHTDREFHGQVFDDFLAATGLSDVCGVLDCGTDADRIDKFVFRGGNGVTLEPLDHTFEREKFVRPTDGAPLSDHSALHVPFRWSVDPGAPGSIRGRVVDSSDVPVPGVSVWAYRPTDGWFGTATAVTAADGTYEITGLAAGDYQVLFIPTGDQPRRAEWFDDSVTRVGANLVTVTAAGVVPGIDATLDAAAAVEGTVTDATGAPVAGALVWAYRTTDSWVGSAAVITDAKGHYTFIGLDPGAYQILFAPWGTGLRAEWHDDAATRGGATPLTLTAAGPPTVVDAVLTP